MNGCDEPGCPMCARMHRHDVVAEAAWSAVILVIAVAALVVWGWR